MALTIRKHIRTEAIFNANDLARFLLAIDEANAETVHVEDDSGDPFIYANLHRETLSDGSYVYNVSLSAQHPGYPSP